MHYNGESNAFLPPEFSRIYIFYRSNEWNDPTTARLLAATTCLKTLYALISNEIIAQRMDYCGVTGKAGIAKLREDFRQDCVKLKRIGGGIVREARNEQLLHHSTFVDYIFIYKLLTMDDDHFHRTFLTGSGEDGNV